VLFYFFLMSKDPHIYDDTIPKKAIKYSVRKMCNIKKIACCFQNKIIGFCLSLYYSQREREREKRKDLD